MSGSLIQDLENSQLNLGAQVKGTPLEWDKWNMAEDF